MKKFRYVFVVEHSSVSFTHPNMGGIGNYEVNISYKNNEKKIVISDSKDFKETLITHNGLIVSVELFSENIVRGQADAQIEANFAITVLSFINNATISEPILMLGYETTETAQNIEFMQILHMEGDLFKKKTIVNPDAFGNFLELMYNNNEKRIGRGIRWYRKGLSEIDPIDKFMYYWLGLESLNKLLANKLNKDDEEVTTTEGINLLFREYEEELNPGFKECKDLRVGLQHGFMDIEKAIGIAANCAESCRQMLIKGLNILTNFLEITSDEYPVPIYNLQIPKLIFFGTFNTSPLNLDVLPMIFLNDINLSMKFKDNMIAPLVIGKIDSNIDSGFNINNIEFIAEDGVTIDVEAKIEYKDPQQ